MNTRVVQLPTQFEGGTIRAQHGNRPAKTYAFGQGSGFGAFFTAFYFDVEHEIQPITAGHRLALVFNLVHLGGGPRPSFEVDAPPRSLARQLRNWARGWEGPEYLVHVLKHEYTQHSLRFDQLKVRGGDCFGRSGGSAAFLTHAPFLSIPFQNKDKETARLLQLCAREAGVVVCLGMVTHQDIVAAEGDG